MFIWKREIVSEKDCVIEFKDGSKETYMPKQLEYIKSEIEQSDSELQNLCANEIVKDLLDVLENHNMRAWDLQFISQKLALSYNSSLDDIVAKVFWQTSSEDIKMLDIMRVKKDFNI